MSIATVVCLTTPTPNKMKFSLGWIIGWAKNIMRKSSYTLHLLLRAFCFYPNCMVTRIMFDAKNVL